MIIITGGNGKLGREIAERLLDRVPAEQIGVSVRDPEKARGLKERGIRVRRGDFADAESLAHAFEGASRVLVVSAGTLGEEAVRLNRTAIGAAKAAGARRILYTSHIGSNPSSPFPPMPPPRSRSGIRAWTSRLCATASTRRRRSCSSGTP